MPDSGWYSSKTTIVSTATDRAVEFTRRLDSPRSPQLDPHDTRGAPPRPPVPGVAVVPQRGVEFQLELRRLSRAGGHRVGSAEGSSHIAGQGRVIPGARDVWTA